MHQGRKEAHPCTSQWLIKHFAEAPAQLPQKAGPKTHAKPQVSSLLGLLYFWRQFVAPGSGCKRNGGPRYLRCKRSFSLAKRMRKVEARCKVGRLKGVESQKSQTLEDDRSFRGKTRIERWQVLQTTKVKLRKIADYVHITSKSNLSHTLRVDFVGWC